MEEVNRWKCCTALNFSSGMWVCVCVLVCRLACRITCLSCILRLGSYVPSEASSFHLTVITLSLAMWEVERKNKQTCTEASLSVCAHKHHRSTAVFNVTSWGSRNLRCINVMQLFIILPEGPPLPFNKHNSYWGVWNYRECCSVIWQWGNRVIYQGRCESSWVLRLIVMW